MATRAQPSGRRLSDADASLVKGMAARGDRHHDIAAWFGVNQGRIAEVLKGKKHAEAEEAEADKLPPSGPYSSGSASYAATEALKASREALQQALKDVSAALEELESGGKLDNEDDED